MAKKDGITVWVNLITDTRSKFWAWIKATIFITLALMYIFWAADFIPDFVGPGVGFVDDAIIFLLAAWAIRGAINTILSKKNTFLSGGKK